MTDSLLDRTPIVTVELQLRPQPPLDSEPYFWGAGMLDFLVAHKSVWRAELPPHELGARAVKRPGFGWVLMLTYSHDEAKRILADMGLPDHLAGEIR